MRYVPVRPLSPFRPDVFIQPFVFTQPFILSTSPPDLFITRRCVFHFVHQRHRSMDSFVSPLDHSSSRPLVFITAPCLGTIFSYFCTFSSPGAHLVVCHALVILIVRAALANNSLPLWALHKRCKSDSYMVLYGMMILQSFHNLSIHPPSTH